jgi:hypothetical protein
MVFVMMGSMEKPKPRKKSRSYIAATGHKAATTSTSTSTTFGSCRSKQEDHNHEHDGQFHIVASQVSLHLFQLHTNKYSQGIKITTKGKKGEGYRKCMLYV